MVLLPKAASLGSSTKYWAMTSPDCRPMVAQETFVSSIVVTSTWRAVAACAGSAGNWRTIESRSYSMLGLVVDRQNAAAAESTSDGTAGCFCRRCAKWTDHGAAGSMPPVVPPQDV